MQSHVSTNGQLTVHYASVVFPKVLFGIAAVLLATAAYDLTIGSRGTERLIGLAGGIGVCVVAGLAALEESRFVFDPTDRSVTWHSRWAWSRSNGRLLFTDIAGVIVQTLSGEVNPSQRLALQLADGRLQGLTRGYSPDPSGELRTIEAQIRAVLGAPPATADDVLAALVRGGHSMEAIRLLRGQGLSLEEAKRRVDVFRKG